ncbi:uncharacterized protein PV09_08204 [Verruconis gallopava]|uniref:Uncharacterized protein n=1 Tax=Verruconis gallopava TaxID=253628 RepID=A0A0D1YHI9_9PEZI|nr:uncharacterized protein PV09_08204 [Verruconis gallopava]KIW00317.1 hypothetical protein PV09_08204 [Verruconis gallopava]
MTTPAEKDIGTAATSPASSSVHEGAMAYTRDPTIIHAENRLQRWANKLDRIAGVEARGIGRVTEEERDRPVAARDYIHMFTIWFSMNCTANQMTLGILGPVAYGLGFTDSIVCCLFGTVFGSCCSAYISTFGPMSGLRTLNVAKYTMGWWPSKLCVILNIVIELGYGVVDCLVAGLILSAVNGGGMTVIVGIIITAIISWLVSTFGIRWFNAFEAYIWAPTVLILFIFIGVASPKFDTAMASSGSGAVLAGNRLSYFFLTASGPLGWSSSAADYYSYYPPKTNRWLTFAMTSSGITLGKLLIEFLGIGLGSGLAANPNWASAFSNHGVGALIVEAFAPLNGFGKFCATVLAICVTANMIPGIYAASLNFQQLFDFLAKVPRPIWSTFAIIVSAVCAIAGRSQLLTIFLNFLGLIGYWTIIWIAMTLEEEFIFRRKSGYDWTVWDMQSALPIGFAALLSFLVGWAGAILCMYQTYYTGVIASKIGTGADLGLPVAMSWAALVYPPLRYAELRFFRR